MIDSHAFKNYKIAVNKKQGNVQMINKIILPFLYSLMLMIMLSSASAAAEQEDATAVETFDESITVKALLAAPIRMLRIRLDKTTAESEYFEYSANTSAAPGIDISYMNLNFRFTTGYLFNSFEDENGKTDYYNNNISYFQNNLMFQAYYQRIKGFYMSNPSGIYPSWSSGDDYPIRRDISSNDAGISLVYKFSEDFSYRAAITQQERQVKSGGTWFIGTQYNYLGLRFDNSLLPDATESYYTPEADRFRGGDFNSLSAFFGGAYTLVFFKKFYASISLAIAPSYSYQRWKLNNQIKTAHGWTLLGRSYPAWATVGFNGDRFLCGLNFKYMNGVSDQYRLSMGIGIEETTNVDIELFAGGRF